MTMLNRTAPMIIAGLLSSSALIADDHASAMGYALAENGNTLLIMKDMKKPADAMSFKLSERLDALAYRPVSGELMGFSKDGSIHTVDVNSGALSDVNAKFAAEAATDAGAFAFDFNNTLDAARLVGLDGTNLVFFPSNFADERANQVLRFTDAFYGEGDINEGVEPLIYANAYTNAINGKKAETTFQYALDARTDSLVSLANNAGTLATVGAVMIDGEAVDLVSAGGFDIVSPEEGMDMAYAVLQLGDANTSGVYEINLETAEATLVADLDTIGVVGFAASLGGM